MKSWLQINLHCHEALEISMNAENFLQLFHTNTQIQTNRKVMVKL